VQFGYKILGCTLGKQHVVDYSAAAPMIIFFWAKAVHAARKMTVCIWTTVILELGMVIQVGYLTGTGM
jgi:hypothetical protein